MGQLARRSYWGKYRSTWFLHLQTRISSSHRSNFIRSYVFRKHIYIYMRSSKWIAFAATPSAKHSAKTPTDRLASLATKNPSKQAQVYFWIRTFNGHIEIYIRNTPTKFVCHWCVQSSVLLDAIFAFSPAQTWSRRNDRASHTRHTRHVCINISKRSSCDGEYCPAIQSANTQAISRRGVKAMKSRRPPNTRVARWKTRRNWSMIKEKHIKSSETYTKKNMLQIALWWEGRWGVSLFATEKNNV